MEFENANNVNKYIGSKMVKHLLVDILKSYISKWEYCETFVKSAV